MKINIVCCVIFIILSIIIGLNSEISIENNKYEVLENIQYKDILDINLNEFLTYLTYGDINNIKYINLEQVIYEKINEIKLSDSTNEEYRYEIVKYSFEDTEYISTGISAIYNVYICDKTSEEIKDTDEKFSLIITYKNVDEITLSIPELIEGEEVYEWHY